MPNPARSSPKWLPAAAWAGVVFLTSCFYIPSKTFTRSLAGLLAGRRVDPAAFERFWRTWWWLFVKGYHVAEYLVLALLLAAWLRGGASRRTAAARAGLIALGYAASDEFHQTFVEGRGGRWTDVAIDALGVALAVAIAARPRAETAAAATKPRPGRPTKR